MWFLLKKNRGINDHDEKPCAGHYFSDKEPNIQLT